MTNKYSMGNLPTQADIMIFAKLNGAREVHRSWRDNMQKQGRKVSPERMDYDALSEEDKKLDYAIANDLYQDFYTWLKSHYIDYLEAD